MHLSHIAAFLVRHFFITKRNTYRAFDIIFWPPFELLLWGFLTLWVQSIAAPETKEQIVYALLSALIVWNMFTRIQVGFSTAFLEERWSHNIANIFIAPVTLREFLAGLITISLAKAFLALLLLTALSWLLYTLNIFRLGFFLLPFLGNILLFGLALGIFVIALVLRYGSSVEVIAWAVGALVQPLSAVFYPVAILPLWLQRLVFFLPTTHMFEGMRSVLVSSSFPTREIAFSFGLNLVYLAGALIFFRYMFHLARKNGVLLRLTTE